MSTMVLKVSKPKTALTGTKHKKGAAEATPVYLGGVESPPFFYQLREDIVNAEDTVVLVSLRSSQTVRRSRTDEWV
jgi:hypothetical protein